MRRFTTIAALLLAPVAPLQAAEPGVILTDVALAPGPMWKRHAIDDTSKGADGVKLGDLNGDGLQDIVTGWE